MEQKTIHIPKYIMPDEKKVCLLVWQPGSDMWGMKNPLDNSHIYRFEDCQFFRWSYPDLVKGEDNFYQPQPAIKLGGSK
jgi:hypothetical protein